MDDEQALEILTERRAAKKEALSQNKKRIGNSKYFTYLKSDEFIWLMVSIISMIAFIAIGIIYYKKYLITIPAFIFFSALYATSLSELNECGEEAQFRAMVFTFPIFFTIGAPLYFSIKGLTKDGNGNEQKINFFHFLLFGIGISFLISLFMFMITLI